MSESEPCCYPLRTSLGRLVRFSSTKNIPGLFLSPEALRDARITDQRNSDATIQVLKFVQVLSMLKIIRDLYKFAPRDWKLSFKQVNVCHSLILTSVQWLVGVFDRPLTAINCPFCPDSLPAIHSMSSRESTNKHPFLPQVGSNLSQFSGACDR